MPATCPHCGEPFELVGRLEVAGRLGVAVDTLDAWRSGRRPTRPPFPDPAAEVSGYAPVWAWEEVERWAVEAGRHPTRDGDGDGDGDSTHERTAVSAGEELDERTATRADGS